MIHLIILDDVIDLHANGIKPFEYQCMTTATPATCMFICILLAAVEKKKKKITQSQALT